MRALLGLVLLGSVAGQEPAPRGGEEHIPGLGALPKGVPAEYEGLGISVQRAGVGTLVAGAQVRYAMARDFERLRAEGGDPETLPPDQVLERVGRPLRTAANGFAIAESEPGRMLVDARFGDLYGWTWVDRGAASRANVVLHPDRRLEVLTVDRLGRPAAAELVFRDADCREVLRASSSGATAAFALDHAFAVLGREGADGGYSISIAGAFPSGPIARFDPATITSTPLTLSLPPASSLVVRVVDPAGAPVTFQPQVEIVPRTRGAACHAAESALADGAGRATFAAIEPGIELDVVADGLDLFADARAVVTSPARAGESLEIALAFSRALPVITGGLENQDGEPLESAFARVWLVGRNGVARELGTFTTKKQKRFVLPIESEPAPAAGETLVFQVGDDASHWYRVGAVVLDRTLAPGRVDLGAVRCEVARTITQGTLVDEVKRPITGASVELLLVPPRAANGSEGAAKDDVSERAPTDFVRTPWSAVSDARGRFRVRGIAPAGELALSISSPFHVATRVGDVEPGKEGLEVALATSASASGRLLLPDGFPRSRIAVVVRDAEGEQRAGVRDDGRFELLHVAPGKFDLEVRADDLPLPFLRVGDLLAVAGRKTPDPRLAALDLSARLKRIVVEVAGPAGEPIESGTASYTLEIDGRSASVVRPISRGRVEVVCATEFVHLDLAAPGHAPLRTRPVAANAHFVLERAP